MKKLDIVLSVVVMVFGLLIMLVPQFILPVCEGTLITGAGKEIPMQCHWTARGEILTGLMILAAGILSLVVKKDGGRMMSGIFAALGGLCALLLVTSVIGVCVNPAMPCVMGAKPAIIILSTFTMLLGAIIALRAGRSIKQND